MAFNVSKRHPAPEVNAGGFDNSSSNVVATQSWVGHILDRIWKWTDVFKTKALEVTGPVNANRIVTEQLRADEIQTSRLTLLDKNGNPLELYIDSNGKLQVHYDYENVFVYPGSGEVLIKCYAYRPGLSEYDNLANLPPSYVLSRFFPLKDNEFAPYAGRICYKLCPSDGAEEPVERTLLISCNMTKVITGLTICDENFRPTKRISLPEGKNVRQLTINMPYFTQVVNGNTRETFIKLPEYGESYGGISVPPPPTMLPPVFNGHIPVTPIVNPLPLNPDLFEDNPIDTDVLHQGENVEYVEPHSTGDDVITDAPEDGGIVTKYGTFVTATYSNVVLKRSDFASNKVQYLIVNTKDDAGDLPTYIDPTDANTTDDPEIEELV